jgi:hypothetical protein
MSCNPFAQFGAGKVKGVVGVDQVCDESAVFADAGFSRIDRIKRGDEDGGQVGARVFASFVLHGSQSSGGPEATSTEQSSGAVNDETCSSVVRHRTHSVSGGLVGLALCRTAAQADEPRPIAAEDEQPWWC